MGITQLRGLQAETAILNRLIQLGYEVLHPWNSSLSYDLAYVVDKEGGTTEFVRVQCKLAWLSNNGACLTFNISTAAEWGRKSHNYHGKAEWFGVYSPDTGRVYMVAVAETGTGAHMVLRLAPPRNNQQKNIKWAKDYEL